MEEAALELSITTSNGPPARVRLVRRITTIGSDAAADVRVPSLPREWAVVHKEASGVSLRVFGSARSTTLAPGETIDVGGVRVALARPAPSVPPEEGLALGALSEALGDASSVEEALDTLLREIVEASSADSGAILLREGTDYAVAVARERDGAPSSDAVASLLSDTVVRDVLAHGRSLTLGDAAAHDRYAHVPSVIAMRLHAVLCVPMKVAGRVVGAIFLGKRDPRVPFSPRVAQDVTVVAAMAVPLLVQLRKPRTSSGDESSVLGDSPAMLEIKRLVQRIAPTDLGVLLLGETGTGKEVIARAIHAASPRAPKPMVAINCSAVPEALLGAELFGAKKGAFTGAIADRVGKIEQAEGSTLFLDEVGDMPLAMQAALLRVLEAREVVRLGENLPRPVDFRLLAATHKDLDAEVAAGRFREDLLYRLREMTITLPALRARPDDIPLLAHAFLRQTEVGLGLLPHRLSDDAHATLLAHAWPGNVRELRAVMRRAAVLAEGAEIRAADLRLDAKPGAPALALALDRTLDEARDAFVQSYVRAVVAKHGGDRNAAAAALGVSVRSLYRHLGGD